MYREKIKIPKTSCPHAVSKVIGRHSYPSNRTGRFELASEGTLLLDEAGELPLPLDTQVKR